MEMSTLIGKMAIFVVLMVIGYICAKSGYVGKEFTRDMSKLVLNVFMCASIVNSVLGTDIELTGRELLVIMALLTVSMVAGYVVAAIGCRVLPMKVGERPLFELLTAVPNTMFIAMPVLSSVFGNMSVFYCSLACIPFNALLYTYGIYCLRRTGEKGGVKLREMFSIPMCATLVALAIFLIKPPVPHIVKELFNTVSSATMPLSMIVIGTSLSTVSLLDSFKNWRLYIMSALRLIVTPLLVWLAVRPFTSDIVLLCSAVVMAASPSAIMVTILAIQYDRDAIYTSEGVLLSTVLSIATIPLLMFFLT